MRFDPASGSDVGVPGAERAGQWVGFTSGGRPRGGGGCEYGGWPASVDHGGGGAVQTLADSYEGQAVQQPERPGARRDRDGSTCPTRGTWERSRGSSSSESVYRIGRDGSVGAGSVTTATKPNGVAVSPDGQILYVSDNGPARRVLLAVDLAPVTGATRRPKVHQGLRRWSGRIDRDDGDS